MESNKLLQQTFHKNMFINNTRQRSNSWNSLNSNHPSTSEEYKNNTQEHNVNPNTKWQFDKSHKRKRNVNSPRDKNNQAKLQKLQKQTLYQIPTKNSSDILTEVNENTLKSNSSRQKEFKPPKSKLICNDAFTHRS